MIYTLSAGALSEPVKALLALLGFALALWLYSFIKKKISHGKNESAPSEPAKSAALPQGLSLTGTDERTAAVLMAVVSKNLGVPLEKLRFQSIRYIPETLALENVSETDAAVIMAITSHQTGIPLQNLSFSRIALIAE